MKLRSLAAAALVFLSVPITARAQETPAAWIAPAYRPELLPPAAFTEAREVKLELTRTPAPLLSKAAKITIIVCAIVVGVIILVGVVSIRPH